jgi:hypothetical protein
MEKQGKMGCPGLFCIVTNKFNIAKPSLLPASSGGQARLFSSLTSVKFPLMCIWGNF